MVAEHLQNYWELLLELVSYWVLEVWLLLLFDAGPIIASSCFYMAGGGVIDIAGTGLIAAGAKITKEIKS